MFIKAPQMHDKRMVLIYRESLHILDLQPLHLKADGIKSVRRNQFVWSQEMMAMVIGSTMARISWSQR